MSAADDRPGRQVNDEDVADGSELTPRIGRPARAALSLNGYTRYEQLTGATPRHLLSLHGVGPRAIRILEEELAARGLAFAR